MVSRGAKYEQYLDRLTASLRVEHRPLHWLSHRVRAGYDRTGTTNTIFLPALDALLGRSPFADRRFGYKEITFRNTGYQTIDYAATASRRRDASAALHTSARRAILS